MFCLEGSLGVHLGACAAALGIEVEHEHGGGGNEAVAVASDEPRPLVFRGGVDVAAVCLWEVGGDISKGGSIS